MTETPPLTPPPGEVPLIDRLRRATEGRYEIFAEIGSGGMATVFSAREVALDREVAIKVMSPAITGTPGAIERFRREARVAAALSHPHIVPIHAIGEEPGIAYYVMKFIKGRSLDAVLHDQGAQSVEFVRNTVSVVGSALHYAHQRGVVHRDVKPANVMLDLDGYTYITDFGIAKRDDGQGLTQSGTIIGTPAYMCPEQFNGAPVTGAADQYSLGIVAFELLAGRAPFDGPSLGEVMRGHLLDPVPPVRSIRPDVPVAVENCVTRMLAKDAADRFPTLADAIIAFDAAAAGAQAAVTVVPAGPRRPIRDTPRSEPTTPFPQPRLPTAPQTVRQADGVVASTPRPRNAISATGASGERRPGTAEYRTPRRSRVGFLLFVLVAAASALALSRGWLRLDLPAEYLAAFAPRTPVATPIPLDIGSALDSTPAAASTASTPAPNAVPLNAVPPDAPADAPTKPPARAAPVPTTTAAAPTATAPVVRVPAAAPESVATTPPVNSQSLTGMPADSAATSADDSGPSSPSGRRGAMLRLQQMNERLVAEGKDPIDAGLVQLGSQSLKTVLFVNGRQRGIIGGRGMQTFPVAAGFATLSIRRLGCTAWDTTFAVTPGERYFLGERSPRC